jgi:hypothetical protein
MEGAPRVVRANVSGPRRGSSQQRIKSVSAPAVMRGLVLNMREPVVPR